MEHFIMNFWASQPIFEVKNILVISKLKLAVNETTHAIYSQNFELITFHKIIHLHFSVFNKICRFGHVYILVPINLVHIILGVMKVL
jgi:hypothetical protein